VKVMRYEDLSEKIKACIVNGCGGKGGFIKPPYRAFYKASCDHHDFGYWRGGNREDKKRCDNRFLEAMMADVARLPWWKRPYYYMWCRAYYIAVVKCGDTFFYFTDKKRRVEDYNWQKIFDNFEPDQQIPWFEFSLSI
jgi:hypothetical protein